jgi:hypothetical protein
MNFSKLSIIHTIIAILFVIAGCSSISTFNHHAYTEDTTLKVEALSLMEKGIDSFKIHQTAIEELKIKLEKAYEFEKGRPNNSITAKMWEKLKDPNKDLLGGYLSLWEKQAVLSKAFIESKKKQITTAFDLIIDLESKKINE